MFKINKNTYLKITNFFKNNTQYYKFLKVIYKLLPIFIFIAYPMLLILSALYFRNSLFKLVLIPASVFALVTFLRLIIDEPRPYETYNTTSVFKKTTKGKSMPSRHTASAFIISVAFLYCNLWLGIIFLLISTLVAISRVLAGVHYIRDVLVGALISIIVGVLFFFIF